MKAIICKFLFLLILVVPFKEGIAEIKFIGASNTKGFGTGSLKSRLDKHLEKNVSFETRALIESEETKVLVALDYFYPTNYSGLGDLEIDHEKRVAELVSAWRQNHDFIVIGTLPHWEDLSEEQKYFLENTPESSTLKNLMQFGMRSLLSGVRIVNESLRNQSELFENIMIMSPGLAVDEFISNPALGAPNKYFRDRLHFNRRGQYLVFNALILPKLRVIFNLNEFDLPNFNL